jgi:hypothetical protein
MERHVVAAARDEADRQGPWGIFGESNCFSHEKARKAVAAPGLPPASGMGPSSDTALDERP